MNEPKETDFENGRILNGQLPGFARHDRENLPRLGKVVVYPNPVEVWCPESGPGKLPAKVARKTGEEGVFHHA